MRMNACQTDLIEAAVTPDEWDALK